MTTEEREALVVAQQALLRQAKCQPDTDVGREVAKQLEKDADELERFFYPAEDTPAMARGGLVERTGAEEELHFIRLAVGEARDAWAAYIDENAEAPNAPVISHAGLFAHVLSDLLEESKTHATLAPGEDRDSARREVETILDLLELGQRRFSAMRFLLSDDHRPQEPTR